MSKDDESTCQGRGKEYDNDNDIAKTGWIGCDNAGFWRWSLPLRLEPIMLA